MSEKPTLYNYGNKIVFHFSEVEDINFEEDGMEAVPRAYRKALNKASDFGGEKYHNESFGGGIAFFDIKDLNSFLESLN